MTWGIYMGIIQDHGLASAHAHLNLVGWVTLALFGTYYHLTPAAAAAQLAKVHYGLALVGVALLVPGIALSITSGNPGLAIAGSFVTLASMLVFLYTVSRHGLGPKV
jgi:cbb3-type cytochrome oxidase subunit 1